MKAAAKEDYGHVSDRWLRELDRQGSRIEFHGVRWPWPLNKLMHEGVKPRPDEKAMRGTR